MMKWILRKGGRSVYDWCGDRLADPVAFLRRTKANRRKGRQALIFRRVTVFPRGSRR